MFSQRWLDQTLTEFSVAKEATPESMRLGGWEFITTAGEDLHVYRKLKSTGGSGGGGGDGNNKLYEYDTRGVFPVSAEKVYDTLMDLDYRKEWEAYQDDQLFLINPKTKSRARGSSITEEFVLMQQQLQQEDTPTEAIYWKVIYPWQVCIRPMNNRDYLVTRKSYKISNTDGSTTWVILQTSADLDYPEQPPCIRVKSYQQSLVLQSHPDGAWLHLRYFEDPRGSIPTSIVNWAVSKAIPRWMLKFQTACLEYKQPRNGDQSVNGASDLKKVLDKSMESAFAI